jgi:predicted transcriptional regulator
MPISEICNREVVYAQRDNSALEAAKLMRQHHVGNLVVVDDKAGAKVPVGIITDRDLVVEIMAPELDQTAITVGDIMTPELAVVKEDAGLYESIQYMRAIGVRRLPVVNDSGGLVGILTLDDMLELLAEEMSTLAKLVKHEQKKETINRR